MTAASPASSMAGSGSGVCCDFLQKTYFGEGCQKLTTLEDEEQQR
jgi:hypothetical protein